MPVSPLDCCMANRSAKPERQRWYLSQIPTPPFTQPLDWHAVMQL
jgi:hypothetical protein